MTIIGGKLTYLYVNKRSGVPKCGDCGMALNGVWIFIYMQFLITRVDSRSATPSV